MKLDISNESSVLKSTKSQDLYSSSGGNFQKTTQGYTIDSRLGAPTGEIVSKSTGNYTVYHSLQINK